MIESKSGYFRSGMVVALLLGALSGCTHVNPATGQSEIDYGATAGVAGAAMGAAALGVALSNNNDDRYYAGPGYYGGGYYGGRRVNNHYHKTNNVYINNSKHVKNRRNAAKIQRGPKPAKPPKFRR